jgi:hypothetical protein
VESNEVIHVVEGPAKGHREAIVLGERCFLSTISVGYSEDAVAD